MSICCCSVAKSYLTLYDSIGCSMPGLFVPHHFPELAQVHVHCISDAIQPSYPLPSSSHFALHFLSIRVFSNEPALCMSGQNGASTSATALGLTVWSSCSPKDYQESVAFPWGFPHRAVTRATVVWVDTQRESRRSAGKSGSSGVDWDIWGTLGMVARPFEFLWTFLLRAPPPEMRRERRQSFPQRSRKGTLILSYQL